MDGLVAEQLTIHIQHIYYSVPSISRSIHLNGEELENTWYNKVKKLVGIEFGRMLGRAIVELMEWGGSIKLRLTRTYHCVHETDRY